MDNPNKNHINLSEAEIKRASLQSQNAREISRIKNEWQESLKGLEILLGREIDEDIEYDPRVWYKYSSSIATNIHDEKVYFSTPNLCADFDFFPSISSKLVAIAHEKFGHSADLEEYYKGNPHEMLSEHLNFVTPEQRANLRAAHLLPDEFFEMRKQGIHNRLRLLGEDPNKLGEYEIYFIAIDALEKIGMPRNDDIPELLKKMQKDTGIELSKFSKMASFSWGLSTPPNLNEIRIYGIKNWAHARELKNIIIQYLKGEITPYNMREGLRNLRYETRSVDGYRPEYSVGLTWVNPIIALKNVGNALKKWEAMCNSNSLYHAPEDMSDALYRIKRKIEKGT